MGKAKRDRAEGKTPFAPGLGAREAGILEAVIREYISTVEPVSSRAIVERHSVGLSPASVRGIMAGLEKGGYLTRAHASAGRVPTDKSFRLYVDNLGELKEPPEGFKELIGSLGAGSGGGDDVRRRAVKALSALTRCAGFVCVPGPESLTVRHIRLLPVDRTGVVVVILSNEGVLHSKLARFDEEVGRLDLEKAANYLNSLGGGLTLRALRDRLLEEMKNEKVLYDRLLRRALRLGEMAVEDVTSRSGKIHFEGTTNIFDQPEFKKDARRMRTLFRAFEEKSLLVRILEASICEEGRRVYMGSELDIKEFEGLSFVTASYGGGDSALSAVGIVGPVRMDYSRIIPLVDYAAGFLGEMSG